MKKICWFASLGAERGVLEKKDKAERRVAGGSLNAPGLSRSGNEFPVVQVHLTYKVVEFVPSPRQDSSPWLPREFESKESVEYTSSDRSWVVQKGWTWIFHIPVLQVLLKNTQESSRGSQCLDACPLEGISSQSRSAREAVATTGLQLWAVFIRPFAPPRTTF